MKKFYSLFIPLFAISLCFTSCSDDEEEVFGYEAPMVFDNYKVISNYEFELSNNKGDMYFDSFSCVNKDSFNISDTWDYATHNNVDKKDIFAYRINGDTIFTVTKINDASFNVKFSETGHKYNDILCYGLDFREKNKENLIYRYAFYYDGERWYSHLEPWHFGQYIVVE